MKRTTVVIANTINKTGQVVPKYFTFGSIDHDYSADEIIQFVKSYAADDIIDEVKVIEIDEEQFEKTLRNQIKDYYS